MSRKTVIGGVAGMCLSAAAWAQAAGEPSEAPRSDPGTVVAASDLDCARHEVLDSALTDDKTADRHAVEHLLETVSVQRARGRIDRMLPLLLRAQALRAEDWRVLWGLGEVHGVNSPDFDPVFAGSCFMALRRSMLASDSDGRQVEMLRVFLREPGMGKDELGTKVTEYLVVLDEERPIRLVKRSDAPVTNLLDRLRVARLHGEQRRALEIGKELEALNPEDPAAHLVIGEAAGSIGPRFNASLAMKSFSKFLQLTEPERFGVAVASPEFSREQFEDYIERVQAGESESGLEALRGRVREWQRELRGKRKLLLLPDRAALSRQVKRLERQRAQRLKQILPRESKLTDERGKRDALRLRYERLEKSRPYGRFDGREDLQRTRDKIGTCTVSINRLERRLASEREKLAKIDRDLIPMRERFEALGE